MEPLALTRDAEVFRVAVVPAAVAAVLLFVSGAARGERGRPLLALAGVVALVSVAAFVLYLPASA